MRRFRHPAQVLLTTLTAVTLAVGVAPRAALASGTVRDDDGVRETSVDMDFVDDTAVKRLDLPFGTVPGASGATLSVYASADGCGVADGPAHRLTVNGTIVADFDPCMKWYSGIYTWANFNIPLWDLVDGAPNTFQIQEIAGDFNDRNAYYGVDQSNDYGRSDIHQASSAWTGDISGELMWYLTFPSGTAAMTWSPSGPVDFGTHPVGSPSDYTVFSVTNTGTSPLLIDDVYVFGTDPGQFAISGDGCTDWVMNTGQSCTVSVRYLAGQAGSHSAALLISGNAGSVSWGLSGTAVPSPPVSTFSTLNGSILLAGQPVTGTVKGDAWVSAEQVTFTPLVSQLAPTSVSASLSCDFGHRHCSWTAGLPLTPGSYLVNAKGSDVDGRVESPGPQITVTVV